MRPALFLVALLGHTALAGGTIPGQLDELWKTRDDEGSITAINALIRQGNKDSPADYEFLWRAARFRWWQADGETDSRKKRTRAKEGWAYADRAVAARPDGGEGKYYVALTIGAYSQAVGILQALGEGLEGKFLASLEAAGAVNEGFDRMGVHTAKGRYHYELPWPKRDLEASRAELTKSLAVHPEHLRNHYYLAQTLLAAGDAKGARAALTRALDGAPDYDPPEARRVKTWSRGLVEKVDAALK